MPRLVVLALVSAALSLPALGAGRSEAAADPVHDVVVGVVSDPAAETWPAFDPAIERFALRTGSASPQVTVTATSSDVDARILVNGREATNGEPLVLTDLASGDEVNVQVVDDAGTSNQSWIVLPPGFPRLTASGPHPDLAPGAVALTLASFLGGNYSAVVDEWGVPVRAVAETLNDLKQSAADPTHYSTGIPAAGGGWRIAELDEQFRETRSHQLASAPADTTDFHDSVLLADGGALLMGYWPVTRDGTVLTDAVIELQDAAGEATWSWNSKDHVDPAEGLVDRSAADYAHINSLQLLPGGDVLASFRNLSQIMRIAGSDGAGHDAGDVLWRFGGVRNDFTFLDDPYGGPCAQHAATLLPDGHLMVFDNGARRDESGPIAPQTADMCPTPGDPSGPRVARPQSRVSEYELDTTTTPSTARLVWSHVPQGRYAPFAGNAQPLPGGNVMVGWSQSEVPQGQQAPVATEVTRSGEEIWSLSAGSFFSYRAFKLDAPDATDPRITVTSPVDGQEVAQGAELPVETSCVDTGGSNLATCAPDAPPRTDEPGEHELVVRATDRAGNQATTTVTYVVTPGAPGTPSPTTEPTTSPTATPTATPTSTPEPTPGPAGTAKADLVVRGPSGRWTGRDTYRARRQTVTVRSRAGSRAVVRFRVRNAGDAAGRVLLSARAERGVPGRWYVGGRDVTARVRNGTFRIPRLQPGSAARLRLVLRWPPSARVRPGLVRLAASVGDSRDVVRVRVRPRG